MIYTDFSKLPIGTKVWHIDYGCGKIIKILPQHISLRIVVTFNKHPLDSRASDYAGTSTYVTDTGRRSEESLRPSLFLNNHGDLFYKLVEQDNKQLEDANVSTT